MKRLFGVVVVVCFWLLSRLAETAGLSWEE